MSPELKGFIRGHCEIEASLSDHLGCGRLQCMDEKNLLARITASPDICHGKPCIRGLRYPVESVLELLSSGMTHQEILDDYEDLEADDLLAAIAWAARLARTKRIEPAMA